MTTFRYLDSEQPPEFVEQLSYEAILAENIDIVKQLAPAWDESPTSQTYKILQNFAYREFLLRERLNSQMLQTLLRFSSGDGVDDIAILGGVLRKDEEEDAELKRRYLLSLEGFSVGTEAGIKANVLSSPLELGDVQIRVTLTIPQILVEIAALKKDFTPLSDAADLATLLTELTASDKVMLGVTVNTVAATETAYSIEVTVDYNSEESNGEALVALVRRNLYALISRSQRLNKSIFLDQITGAINQIDDALESTITVPVANLDAVWNRVYICPQDEANVIIILNDVAP